MKGQKLNEVSEFKVESTEADLHGLRNRQENSSRYYECSSSSSVDIGLH